MVHSNSERVNNYLTRAGLEPEQILGRRSSVTAAAVVFVRNSGLFRVSECFLNTVSALVIPLSCYRAFLNNYLPDVL